MEVPETVEIWCMKCKGKKVIQNPRPTYMSGVRGQRLQLTGKCPDCGMVVNRFMKTEKEVPPPSPPVQEEEPALDDPSVVSQQQLYNG